MDSLVQNIINALTEEEKREAFAVGRGQTSRETRDERIGVVKGLGRALQIVGECLRQATKDEEVD